jgi:hypothetical protein
MDISPEELAELARLVAELRYQSSPLRRHSSLDEAKAARRAYIRELAHALRENPEYREKRNTYAREWAREQLRNNPEYKEKIRARDRKRKHKRGVEPKKKLSPEERREKTNQYAREWRRKRLVSDPEYYRRRYDYIRDYSRERARNDLEYRERKNASTNKWLTNNPEYLVKQRERRKDLKYKEKRNAQLRERRKNDPKYRERLIAQSREKRKRNKTETTTVER